MNEYTLQAMTQDSVQEVIIDASNDEDAMFQAIDQVMGRATTSLTWAIGRITLYSPDGTVIKEMLAKRGTGGQEQEVDLPVFGKMFHKMTGL
jgi:glucose-6-phosphate isomerase